MKSKKQWDTIKHCHRRARERYDANESVIQRLLKIIKRGGDKDILHKRKQTWTRSEFLIRLDGELYGVIYDKTRKIIVTFLPKTAIDYENQTLKTLFFK